MRIERLDARIENSEEELFEEVLELGKRLFFDPSGPTQLYGNEPDCRSKVRTSWTGEAINPNDPGVLVRKLEATALGCCWMRDRWEELRTARAGQILAIPRSLQGHPAPGPAAARRRGR